MYNSDVIFQQVFGPSSKFALVAMVGERVALHVVLQVPLGQVCLSTQVAGMWPLVQVSVDMSLKSFLVCEAVTTVWTNSVCFFFVHVLYMGVFEGH